MSETPRQITLQEWDGRYAELRASGLRNPVWRSAWPARRRRRPRLLKLRFDNSPAALRLWNFLLTEEERLHGPRGRGQEDRRHDEGPGHRPGHGLRFAQRGRLLSRRRLVDAVPDGAQRAAAPDRRFAGHRRVVLPGAGHARGVRERRAFPHSRPADLQRRGDLRRFFRHRPAAGGLGYPDPLVGNAASPRAGTGRSGRALPGGFSAPQSQVEFVEVGAAARPAGAGRTWPGNRSTTKRLAAGIAEANQRPPVCWPSCGTLVFTAEPCPLPALEMLIAEMLAIHFCSDRDETIAVLEELLAEVSRRVDGRGGRACRRMRPASSGSTRWPTCG